jgi:hypothetical protein
VKAGGMKESTPYGGCIGSSFQAADGRCDLQSLVGHDGRGMAESLFHGTLDRDGTIIKALGAEVFEFADERIKEIRDHHRVLN